METMTWQDLAPYLSLILGTVLVPIMKLLKKIGPLAEYVPYEHQKIVVAVGVTFLIAAVFNIEASPIVLVKEAMVAVSAGMGTYAASKYTKAKGSGRRYGR